MQIGQIILILDLGFCGIIELIRRSSDGTSIARIMTLNGVAYAREADEIGEATEEQAKQFAADVMELAPSCPALDVAAKLIASNAAHAQLQAWCARHGRAVGVMPSEILAWREADHEAALAEQSRRGSRQIETVRASQVREGDEITIKATGCDRQVVGVACSDAQIVRGYAEFRVRAGAYSWTRRHFPGTWLVVGRS